MISKACSPKAATILLASTGPMPRTMPEPRYFSMPSAVVGGGVVLRKSALNWRPSALSVTQTPDSMDELAGADRGDGVHHSTGTRSRLPRAFTFSTAKPFSSLWNVTRSTEPTSASLGGAEFDGCKRGIRRKCHRRHCSRATSRPPPAEAGETILSP